MQVNRLNVAAMGLMAKDRAPEAELTLRKALLLAPKNPFTLNNLGYALEKEGELEQAIRYYDLATLSGSGDKVVVAFNRGWRGRPISEIAGINAQGARRELATEASSEAKVTRLNLRGVSALNRNQVSQARQFLQQAYRIDPGNAFSLNNMGYISEVEGDRETADYYYAKAREANRSSVRVALATRKSVEGQKLASVAGQNEQTVQVAEERRLAALRAQGGPPAPLRTRDFAVVREPARPPIPEPVTPIRIVAEDNPPPEPLRVVAAPARRASSSQPRPATPSAPAQPAATVSAAVASAPTQAAAMASAPAQPAPVASTPTPPAIAQPVPTIQPAPQDEMPLFPVIPDE
jgi:Flp pilus assembly protein TadD